MLWQEAAEEKRKGGREEKKKKRKQRKSLIAASKGRRSIPSLQLALIMRTSSDSAASASRPAKCYFSAGGKRRHGSCAKGRLSLMGEGFFSSEETSAERWNNRGKKEEEEKKNQTSHRR